MSEFECEGGFAASGHAGEAENDAGFEALVQEIDIGFTTDEERWARGQQIDAWRRGGVFSEEPGGDLAEACGIVAAEVKVAFVCGAGGGFGNRDRGRRRVWRGGCWFGLRRRRSTLL